VAAAAAPTRARRRSAARSHAATHPHTPRRRACCVRAAAVRPPDAAIPWLALAPQTRNNSQAAAKESNSLLSRDNPELAEKFAVIGSGSAECKSCQYVYEPKMGDDAYPVAKGTLFQVRLCVAPLRRCFLAPSQALFHAAAHAAAAWARGASARTPGVMR
jgi:hypothetical protein